MHSPQYIAENVADDVGLGLHTADGGGNHLLASTAAVVLCLLAQSSEK